MKTFFRILLLLLLCGTLYAQNNYTPDVSFIVHQALVPHLSTAPEIESRSAVMVDAVTGTALFVKNPRDEIPPASLTKLMTLHLLQKEVDSGRKTLNAIVPIGKESWAKNQPSRSSLMFLEPGQAVTLKEIMLGLAISSGNDAAIAAALYLAPSVEEFASMMTQEARRMGLQVTRFVDPSGVSELNMTTAFEYAVFCREYVRLHPKSLTDLHSVLEFGYPKAANVAPALRGNPGTIVQANRNSLLRTFPGVDGLKTGYIDESGYNIVLTAQRDGTRFIAVILGAPAQSDGDRIRDRDGEKLLSWAFQNFKTVRYRIGPVEPAQLWKGKEKQVELIPAEYSDSKSPIAFTAPIGRGENIYHVTEFAGPFIAPLPAYYPAGQLIIFDEFGELQRIPLVTAKAYKKGNIFRRIWDSVKLFFSGRN